MPDVKAIIANIKAARVCPYCLRGDGLEDLEVVEGVTVAMGCRVCEHVWIAE